MTEALLVLTISVFCGIKDKSIPEEKKLDCLEYVTNCSVGRAGKIETKTVEKCKKDYVETSSN